MHVVPCTYTYFRRHLYSLRDVLYENENSQDANFAWKPCTATNLPDVEHTNENPKVILEFFFFLLSYTRDSLCAADTRRDACRNRIVCVIIIIIIILTSRARDSQ